MTVVRATSIGARQRTLAIAIALISLVLAAVSFLLIALTPDLDVLSGWGFVGFDGAFAIVYLAVGLMILTRRPGNVIGWLFLIYALISGIQTVTTSYAGYALRTGSPNGSLALWISNWIWISAVALIILMLLLYPDGRLPSPGWRWAAMSLAPVTAATTFIWAIAAPEATPDAFAVNPFALEPDHPLRGLAGPSILLLSAWILIAGASLRARMRRGDTIVRQQIKWIAFAAALVGVTLAFSIIATLIVPVDQWQQAVSKGAQLLSVGSVILIPIAAAVAILRYRLYDIDVLINRTLVYGALSAGLVATYVLSVLALSTLLRPLTGSSDLGVAGSTLAVVALFGPLRQRIQRAVDRRFSRSRYDAERTVDAFTARLRDEVDLDALSRELVDVARETVHPAHAGLWLRGVGR